MKKNKKIIFCIICIIILLLAITLGIFKYNEYLNEQKQLKYQEEKALENLKRYNEMAPVGYSTYSEYYGSVDILKDENITFEGNIAEGYSKVNISPDILKEHKFENFIISNMKIHTEKDLCYITFYLQKISDNNELSKIRLNYYDSNGDSIYSTITYDVTDMIQSQTIEVSVESIFDVSNSFDYDIIAY